jgi:hypothetical protein
MANPSGHVPAVQFFGAKGFFPSYDAKPQEPLDRATARVWIDGICAIAAGRLNTLELAQAVARASGLGATDIPFAEFRRLLSEQLAFIFDGAPAAVASAAPTPAEHPQPVTRAVACEYMYDALARTGR